MTNEERPDISTYVDRHASNNAIRPVFFRLYKKEEEEKILRLLEEKPFIRVHDTLKDQLEELVKILHPAAHFNKNELQLAVQKHLGSCLAQAYGVWVYYPWNEQLVHILDEKEFILLRTNRNKYKITDEERDVLATKKVGIIGLSVGQSVALTLAMERGFGELRIADFDTLELSNLNRLRAGIHQLGVPKTSMVAREIAEIDPFLEVSCFNEGINKKNLECFLSKGGKLDLLIDECDSLDIKILCRQKAREQQIPVLMDTSDRGMIDIERFDLEPGREVLHGLLGDTVSFVEQLKDPIQRLKLSLQIAGGEELSKRLMASLPEIGKSIRTWPQLASAVALGGAVVTEISRKVLLKDKVLSGRFYIDVDELIKGN